jgi:Holliday junction resolvase RusA-like endonuclease
MSSYTIDGHTFVKLMPLSANKAWQGRRFKTSQYVRFEAACLHFLPKKPPFVVHDKMAVNFVFGFSNALSDIDNPIKMCLDILCKKYGFNDNKIYGLRVEKKIVKKGEEFWAFSIEEYLD